MEHQTELVTDDYCFFWKGIFSQWKRGYFQVGEETFNCCEQWMMAYKAALFGDLEIRRAVMATRGPRNQKALGREVRNFDEAIWDAVKEEVVYLGNLHRALQNREFRDALLATGNKTIVEASLEDRVWGIGFYADEALEHLPEWGENLLGVALMRVRSRLALLPNPLPDTSGEGV